jgi:putative endonuclease
MNNTEKKHVARLYGIRAETLGGVMLTLKGYKVRERNFRIKGGEVDIIATKGNLIVFVEVKARPTMVHAMRAINPVKVERISLAARTWLSRNAWAAGLTWRGDAIYVAPRCWPRHGIAAYQLKI